ncbi:MAG: aspartyl protease family protein [Opitutales bacterium]|jgi:predicted aspartyl protease
MHRLLTLLLVALTAHAGAQDRKVLMPKAELPASGYANVRLVMKTIPTVRVKVNGVELVLGVDTGCQGSGVLTERACQKLGLKPDFSLPTMGNTGQRETAMVRIDTLEMGGGTWRNFHVAMLPLKGMNFDGLVGAEILFGGPFYMDLANRTMLLGQVPDTAAAHEVPCFSRGGHCNVNIEVDGRKVPVLIDSGASRSYLTAMKFPGKVAFRGYGQVATVRGVSVRRQELCLPKSVRIGGMPLRGVSFYRDNEHNILGDDFLLGRPIAIDRASRRVWLFPPAVRSETVAKAPAQPSERVAEPAR